MGNDSSADRNRKGDPRMKHPRTGDFDVVPLFRALASGAVNFGGNGGATNGLDCAGTITARISSAPASCSGKC